MNKAIMMGRLTADPDVRQSGSDDPILVSKFRIAVDRKTSQKGDAKTADYFSCTAFGRKAEIVEKYLRQGIKVLVTGRLENDNYTNRDGDKIYGINLIVNDIEFPESKKASEDRDGRDSDHEDRNSQRSRRSDRQDDRDAYDDRRRSSRSDFWEDDRGRAGSRRSVEEDNQETGRRSSRNTGDQRRNQEQGRASESRGRRSRRDEDDDFMDMDYMDADIAFD